MRNSTATKLRSVAKRAFSAVEAKKLEGEVREQTLKDVVEYLRRRAERGSAVHAAILGHEADQIERSGLADEGDEGEGFAGIDMDTDGEAT